MLTLLRDRSTRLVACIILPRRAWVVLYAGALPLRQATKVKTFLGSDAAEVDKQVNHWPAKSKVQVRRTNTAFKRFRDKGKDALTGRTEARYGVEIAISVWYNQRPAKSQIRTGWSGKLSRKGRR